MSLMGSLAVYACGETTPTGPIVATIKLPTSLLLWTSPAERRVSDHVYASPGGLELFLTLYLPEYRDFVLSAQLSYEAGGRVSGTSLTWTSSDASVVTVSSEGSTSGAVSATGVGSATITASADGVTSNPVSVTVSEGGGPLPAIVYLHGGAFNAGDRSELQPQAAYMATKGFVGATIE